MYRYNYIWIYKYFLTLCRTELGTHLMLYRGLIITESATIFLSLVETYITSRIYKFWYN
jgi:hypothetical protein